MRSRPALRAGALLLLATTVLSACAGSGQKTLGAADPKLTAEGFLYVLSRAACAEGARCCAFAGVAARITYCDTSTFVPGGRRGGAPLFFDERQAARCLAAVEEEARACREPALASSACANVWHGGKKAGERCRRDSECAPMADADTFCRDVCHVALPAREGAACGFSSLETAGDCRRPVPGTRASELVWGDGLRCDEAAGVCRRRKGDGGPCVSPRDCSFPDKCVDGACRKTPIGAPCVAHASSCSDGLFCGPGDRCQAYEQRPLGAACAWLQQCDTRACRGVCVPDERRILDCSVGGIPAPP